MNPQDPLAELKGLVHPDQIGLWPLAPGWWIIIALLALCTFLLLKRYKNQRAANAYRREALEELTAHWQQFVSTRNSLEYLQALAITLKRTALSGFPGMDIGSANGDKWLAFLDQSLPDKHSDIAFQSEHGQLLVSAPYQKSCSADPEVVHKLSLNWIRHHKVGRANRA